MNEAIKIYPDGREVCNLRTTEGMDEYLRRKRVMWERQGRRCCLEHVVAGCRGKLAWKDAMFEHEEGRGFDGAHRDDRIERMNPATGKMEPVNGVAHAWCNSLKGSTRIKYNTALYEAP